MSDTLLVAQLGAPTAVVNQTLVGIIEEARSAGVDRVLGARNGVLGLVHDEFYELDSQPPETLSLVARSPGAALGSCRYNLRNRPEDIERICEVLDRRQVTQVIFIGGGGTMGALDLLVDTAMRCGREVRAVGAPKTIDNDLLGTDHAPGFGSVAKYMATTVQESGRDTEALATFDVCTVVEAMGRDTGWIAASAALAARERGDAPHLVVMPEIEFRWDRFGEQVRAAVSEFGRCVVVVCEGLTDAEGRPLAATSPDPSGQMQFAGAGGVLRGYIQDELGLRCRYNKPGTAQRNAVHCASLADALEADAVGREAVRALGRGETRRMVRIEREPGPTYKAALGLIDLAEVAGKRRYVPREFLDEAGTGVSQAFREYLTPLVRGRVDLAEAADGLPLCARLKGEFAAGGDR